MSQDDEQSSNVLRYQSLEIWPDKECNESDTSYSKGWVRVGVGCLGITTTTTTTQKKSVKT